MVIGWLRWILCVLDRRRQNIKMIMMNGDHLSDDEDEVIVDAEEPLIFQDDTHHLNLLQSLNTMRKNRTFCDVILHVSILYFRSARVSMSEKNSRC